MPNTTPPKLSPHYNLKLCSDIKRIFINAQIVVGGLHTVIFIASIADIILLTQMQIK